MANEKLYCLYIHTTPSGKKYVGVTSQNPKGRWHNGKGYKSSYFERAIKKYGWANITHEIVLTGLTRDDALRLEREYIQTLDTTNRSKGYNLSCGGEVPANDIANEEEYKLRQSINSHRQWENSKTTISRATPPRPSVNVYKKRVYQYDKDWNLIAVHQSVAECAKAMGVTKMPVSEACNGKARTCRGYFLRFEDDKYLSNGKRGAHCARAVVQMDIDSNVIATFDSAAEAARAFGKKTSCTILDACKGRQITAYGYRWRFKENAG